MLENIKNTKALLLDLDGTVYIDGVLIGDVKNTLQYFRDKGIKIVYLTNNSSRTDSEYVERLTKTGIYQENDLIYSSLDSAIDYINLHYKGKSVYAVASEKVSEELKNKGINIVDDNAEIVLLTFDRELNYQKIVRANEHMVKGAIYIATHPDLCCPTDGIPIPDLGSFTKMFKASSGREPQIITGKPFAVMTDNIIKRLGIQKEYLTMVGDRLSTDIAFGVNSSINSVLVLTGETDMQMAESSSIKADLTLNSIDDLKSYVK